MKRLFTFIFILSILMGPTVTLRYAQWDPHTDPTVTGYKLYWGAHLSGIFDNYTVVALDSHDGNHAAPCVDLTIIIPSVPGYYDIVVTAVNASGESGFSNQVTWIYIVIGYPENFMIQ
jgi:hypothetical protein